MTSDWLDEPDWKRPEDNDRLVVFCTPAINRPYDIYLDALAASVPVIEAAGWKHAVIFERDNPYISQARNGMLRKALDANPTCVVFLDYDMGWRPTDLLKLIEADADVVAGLYRCRHPGIRFMGTVISESRNGMEETPVVRADGLVEAELVPAGFLKVTPEAVHKFMRGYPELCFGPKFHPAVDLFNHGAHEGLWWGEDFAFSRRWRALGEKLWVIPDVTIDHRGFVGNFHEYMLRRPGGFLDPARMQKESEWQRA